MIKNLAPLVYVKNNEKLQGKQFSLKPNWRKLKSDISKTVIA